MATKSDVVVKFALKHWPVVLTAFTAVTAFVKDHPEVPTWVRSRLDDVQKKVDVAIARRGDAARVRGMLDVARDTARDVAAHAPAGSATGAEGWLRRADTIELGVRIAERQAKPQQKVTFARLRTQTDVLLADVLDALSDAPTQPAG